jgi:hypothetical protein
MRRAVNDLKFALPKETKFVCGGGSESQAAGYELPLKLERVHKKEC